MNTFKIGVTGTRTGMTHTQRDSFVAILNSLLCEHTSIEFHHGDCVGVDIEAANIAQELRIRTVCHPPVDSELRAFHTSDEIREPKTHFARNRNIVSSVELLIVIPWQMEWNARGGTWYTHDYAVKNQVEVNILWPYS